MKMVKSLLLGSAAGLVALTGAQAADLPVKAAPVQYVKICSLYGAGFFYMPGTDTCLKVGGFVRAEVDVNAGGSFSVNQSGRLPSSINANEEFWRTRAGVTFDARTQTAYGTLRSYMILATTEDNGETGITAPQTAPGTTGGTGVGNNPGGSGRAPYTRLWSNAAFIQLAGFTVGKTASFFDFDTQPYSNQTNFWSSNYGGSGIDVFAYTAQFGNGWSASLSVEEPAARRMSITSNGANNNSTPWQYGNQQVPDIVGNIRIDQAWGSAQVMAAYHQVRGVNIAVVGAPDESSKSGWAVGGGLKWNLPMFGAKDYVVAQATYSEGVLSYVGQGINGGFNTFNENGTINSFGPAFDAVVTNAATGDMDLTKALSITAGFEHFWSAQWKTSLYGATGELRYSDAAAAVLRPAGVAVGSSANWQYSQIGSRTVWTPVANLDLSVEVMYNKLNTAFGTPGDFEDKNWWSGIFRVQRNFYP
jgi:Porin subfamily